jgi:hypothetical protein
METNKCSVTLIFTINDIFLRTGKNKVALMVNIKHHGFFTNLSYVESMITNNVR